MTTNNLISPMKFCFHMSLRPFLNNPIDLDLSYKMDLDFWDCCKRKKSVLLTEEIWYVLGKSRVTFKLFCVNFLIIIILISEMNSFIFEFG